MFDFLTNSASGFGTRPTFSSLLRWRNFEFLSFDDPQKYFLKSERLFWTKSQRNFFITFFPSSELSKAKAMRVLFAGQWRCYLFSNPEVLTLNPPDVFLYFLLLSNVFFKHALLKEVNLYWFSLERGYPARLGKFNIKSECGHLWISSVQKPSWSNHCK